jgi:hypothetical protein
MINQIEMIALDDITYKDKKVMSGSKFIVDEKDISMLLNQKAAKFSSSYIKRDITNDLLESKPIIKQDITKILLEDNYKDKKKKKNKHKKFFEDIENNNEETDLEV